VSLQRFEPGSARIKSEDYFTASANLFVVRKMMLKCISRKLVMGGKGRAVAQAIGRRLPMRRPGFEPRSSHMGSVVDKVALVQNFSEY
jgi:hypothetical protein